MPYNTDPPRSRPGGWAYPGTITLGDGGSVNASGVLNGGLTYDENAVHFGARGGVMQYILRWGGDSHAFA